MTDFLVKTCKQGARGQVRVGKTCGPFPFFLLQQHLGDLWSECQRWKYTNRYSPIIYSQVYIPKTVTFHYFSAVLENNTLRSWPLLSSDCTGYPSTKASRCSKRREGSRRQIQAAEARTGPKCRLRFVCLCYSHCAPRRYNSQRKGRALLRLSGNASGPGSCGWDAEKAGFKANLTRFCQCSKNLKSRWNRHQPLRTFGSLAVTACNKSSVWAGAIECKSISSPPRNHVPAF